MSINGAVKFFEQSYALFKNGVTATATSNDDAVKYILDVSRYTEWISIGSNDLTVETLLVTLPADKTINRIFLRDMNLKDFTVKYWNGSAFTAFTNVIGVNGVSTSGITETAYARDTSYYEFDAVSTDKLQILANKSQVVDAEKFIGGFVVTEEIGTFEGFPRVQPAANRNETRKIALSKRAVIQKSYETNKVKITFKTHPYQSDLDIIETLFDREEPFLVYPCGGRTGTTYFKVEQKNWRLKDIYNVQLTGGLKNEYEKGVYTLGFNKSITMAEHI